MGIWNLALVVLVALGGIGFIFALLWSIGPWRPAMSGHRSPPARHGPEISAWPPAWSCSTPEQPLTIAEAHRTMQMHREHYCARKRAAFATLIAAGHIKPDSSRRG
jgi:hypothetical protein